jgi:hypothetical protein
MLDKWALLHKYRRAVALELVPEIRCPDDNDPLVPILDEDGDPSLRCIYCRTVFRPGTAVFVQMSNNLRGIDV